MEEGGIVRGDREETEIGVEEDSDAEEFDEDGGRRMKRRRIYTICLWVTCGAWRDGGMTFMDRVKG